MLGSVLKRVFGIGSGFTALREGIAAYEHGSLADAARLLGLALQKQPDNVEARLFAGLTAYRSERYGDALGHFERAVQLDPANSDYQYHASKTEWLMGRGDAAWKRCETVLQHDPNHSRCHFLMARIALPGPDYFDVLSLIHGVVRPGTYVEVGVFRGYSMALARPETRVIGIDPDPKIDFPLPSNCRVVTATSDDYFATHDVTSELGGQPVDLAFIDGMHQFEYALRDFINIERHCTARSIVLLHDCYPLDRRTAERNRTTTFSSGDVWRLVLILKKYRPDLTVNTIATSPTGLGVVQGLDPASSRLQHRMEDIVAEFMTIDYSVIEIDKPVMLNRFPNDPEKITGLVRQSAH